MVGLNENLMFNNCEIYCEKYCIYYIVLLWQLLKMLWKNCVNSLFTISSLETCQKDNTIGNIFVNKQVLMHK